ncbi:uncharacterized protein LOC134293103 [Anolis carolinensis]|uniref:uncharacterized protein LOC134293103 n=1 Tax=Anolis carolinensis TaxID=28377 RepID=UPI002F2B6D02
MSLPLVVVVVVLGLVVRPSAPECPPSQRGNDTGVCDCQTMSRIFRDCLRCPPELGCQCATPEKLLLNVTDFYGRFCWGPPPNIVYVAFVVPIMGALLILAMGYLIVRSRKQAPSVAGDSKRSSNTSEGHSRYANQGSWTNYENSFMDRESRRGSRPPQVQYAAGPHGEQPIYANSQGVYYNYVPSQVQGVQREPLYARPDH